MPEPVCPLRLDATARDVTGRNAAQKLPKLPRKLPMTPCETSGRSLPHDGRGEGGAPADRLVSASIRLAHPKEEQVMKRVLTALLSAALLVVPAVPANAAPTPGVCDEAAMDKILDLGYVWDTPWDRCQFKLFLPNHQNLTWNQNEWFHGSDFFSKQRRAANWFPDSPGYQDVLDYYAQIEEHLYWGKLSTPLWALTEVTLSRGPIRAYAGSDYDGTIYARETYFNFHPHALGVYKWRYTWADAQMGQRGDVRGHITIQPAPNRPTF